MEDLVKKQCKEIVRGLFPRFMHQYKNEKWTEIFVDDMYGVVNAMKDKLHELAKKEVSVEMAKLAKEEYKDYIPNPSKSLGTRLRFLFTGELN